MTASARRAMLAAVATLFVAAAIDAQQPPMPPGMTHEEHMAQMKAHGNVAMGFDQDKTTHHFTMTADGGAIAVDANDAADVTSRDQIRAHLKEIAAAFRQGDFGKPLETHSELPPGVPVMQRLKGAITYTFEQTAHGGVVRIATKNAEALAAIHDFLRYQIEEHATGDPLLSQNHTASGPANRPQGGAHAMPMAQADHFDRHFDNADDPRQTRSARSWGRPASRCGPLTTSCRSRSSSSMASSSAEARGRPGREA